VNKNLSIVIASDVAAFCGLILWFWLDSGRFGLLGSLTIVAFVWLAVLANKVTKKPAAELSPDQKKIRFVVTAVCFVLLIALVLLWAIRLNSRAAWAFASLGMVIMAALFYAGWDQLNDELKKTNCEAQRKGEEG
jgi:hypothetical protein